MKTILTLCFLLSMAYVYPQDETHKTTGMIKPKLYFVI